MDGSLVQLETFSEIMVDAIRHLNGVINNFYLKCIKFVKNSVAFSKNCALKWLKYIIIVLSY